MSKKQNLNYFPLSSNIHFTHFMGCSGHKLPICDVLTYHLLFKVLCCAILERSEICQRCNNCFFCIRIDNLIKQFNNLDKLNSADNDLFWTKVSLDLNLANGNSFGNILGVEKIRASRETAEKLKLL